MDKIKRLQELYIEFNKLKFSGEDVVSEIRAEINDIELQILKEEIFPKAMEELANRLSVMRCTIDFSFQYDGKGTIDYSFCKSDSMSLIRDKVEGHFLETNIQQIKQIVREPRLQRITKAPSSYSRQTAVEYDSGIDASQTKSKLSPWDFKQYLEKVNKLSGGDSYTNSSINVYTSVTQSKYIRSKIEKYVVSGILYDLVDLSVLMNLMDDIMKDVAEDITPNSTLMAIKLYIQMLNDKELLVQSDDL